MGNMKQPSILKQIDSYSNDSVGCKIAKKQLEENRYYLYQVEGATQSSQAPRKKITLQNLERFLDLEETNIIRSDT